jgi:hypothetical protein
MNGSLRVGSLVLGLGVQVLLAGTAGAQQEATAGDAGRYSGTSGSQALQEQMYEERMRDLLGEPSQMGQPSQGTEQGTKEAGESSQKMRPEKSGDRMMSDEKTKGTR